MNAFPISRRRFVDRIAAGMAGAALDAFAQLPGERPPRADGVAVLNPRTRVPVSIIIDDSTVLVNLNRFAMPQFNEVYLGAKEVYQRNWRDWPP